MRSSELSTAVTFFRLLTGSAIPFAGKTVAFLFGYAIGPAQLSNRLPFGFALPNFFLLMGCQLVLSTHPDATTFGPLAAFSSTVLDQFAFEFGQA